MVSLAFWVSNYVVCRFSVGTVGRVRLVFSAVIDVKVIDFKIHTQNVVKYSL